MGHVDTCDTCGEICIPVTVLIDKGIKIAITGKNDICLDCTKKKVISLLKQAEKQAESNGEKNGI